MLKVVSLLVIMLLFNCGFQIPTERSEVENFATKECPVIVIFDSCEYFQDGLKHETQKIINHIDSLFKVIRL